MEYSKTGSVHWNCILLLFPSGSVCKTRLLSSKHHARSWMYTLYFQLSCYVTLNISLNLLTHRIFIWKLITVTCMSFHLCISCILWVLPLKCLVERHSLKACYWFVVWHWYRQSSCHFKTDSPYCWDDAGMGTSHVKSFTLGKTLWCSEFGIEVSILHLLKSCVNFLRIWEQNDTEQASRPTECVWM